MVESKVKEIINATVAASKKTGEALGKATKVVIIKVKGGKE